MIAPPKYVLNILCALDSAGHRAVLAGGCVRDSLLGRRPSDWDIASSASPEEVLALFPRCVPTGIKHGTVTVLSGGGSVEVTAFRAEGGYSDHRRPDSVSFGCPLEADLARRDLTVNAMAMDAAGEITDPFGGRDDLRRRLLRCVGEPERRFDEDALRMLRTVRFSAQLGFEIEPRTLEAIRALAHLASGLSAERVRDELLKTLRSPAPGLVWQLVDLGLLGACLAPGDASAPREALDVLPIYARLAHFCRDLELGGYIMSTDRFLAALRFDGETLRRTASAVEVLKSGSRDWKRLLRGHGVAAVLAAHPKNRALRAVLRSGECWELSSLAIGGRELAALGYSGPELGRELRRLLDHVIDCPADNRADILCKLVERKV
ncbi:MAG: CCA tRNA nucleotidyltransferase [Lachnospiraceae bacterium]